MEQEQLISINLMKDIFFFNVTSFFIICDCLFFYFPLLWASESKKLNNN